MNSRVGTCDQCRESFISSPLTHSQVGQAVDGLIMAGFCSEDCERAWFREDRIVRLNLELMADLGMERSDFWDS